MMDTAELIAILLKQIDPDVVESLGDDNVKKLLKSTIKNNGSVSNATLEMIKQLNSGVVSKQQASKAAKEAAKRLEENNYDRTAVQQLLTDVGVPLLGITAENVGLGIYLKNQIIPALLTSMAEQQAKKVNPLINQATSIDLNPTAAIAAYANAKNNVAGRVALNAGQQLNSLAQKEADILRGQQQDKLFRSINNDNRLVGSNLHENRYTTVQK